MLKCLQLIEKPYNRRYAEVQARQYSAGAVFALRIEGQFKKSRAYLLRIVLCRRNGAIPVAGQKQLNIS